MRRAITMTTRTNHLGALLALLLAAALAAGLLALVGTKPAGAAFLGQNGKIVYESGGIYTVSSSGGAATEVLANTAEDVNGFCCKRTSYFSPALSPDGKKIAFVKAVNYSGVLDAPPDEEGEIFTIPVTGGEPTRLTNNDTYDISPTWSPDGKKIAYECEGGPNFGRDVCTISAAGGEPTRVTTQVNFEESPAWSPGGTKIAYAGIDIDGRGYVIYTVPATGGKPTKVTNNADDRQADEPAWSPDGKKIAYQASDGNDQEIFTIPATGPALGADPTQLTDNQRHDHAPAFSPDSTKIVYHGDVGTEQGIGALYELLTVPSSGGESTVVPVTNSSHNKYPDWGPAPGTALPVAAAPEQSFVVGSTLGTTTVPVRLKWGAADIDGIASYTLQQSTGGGPYTNVSLPTNTTTSFTLASANLDGTAYRFRARAQDNKGNLSAWAVGLTFVVGALEEDSFLVSYPSGTWASQALSGAHGGSVKYATAAGATAKLSSFWGRNFAWVAPKGPNRGKAEVWVDGVKEGTVDLYSADTQSRKVVFTKSWGYQGSHTIEIKVLGQKRAASTGTRVDIDAFAGTDASS